MIHHDFETFATCNLLKAGAYAYAQHPDTRVICLAYTLGDTDEPALWWEGDPDPLPLLDAIERGEPVAAWNDLFERAIWEYVIARQCPHWPRPKFDQWHDVMAWALSAGLPPALGMAAQALGLGMDAQKDKSGRRVMLKLSKPRRVKGGDVVRWTWDDACADYEHLGEYCRQDVRTERATAKIIKPLTPAERETYQLDHEINDAGIPLDVGTCQAAIRVIDLEKQALNRRMSDLTGGAVTSVNQTKELTAWLRSKIHGVEGIAANHIREMLQRDDLPDDVRDVLKLRLDSSKTSLAKFDAMLQIAGDTNTAQGAFQYHGAGTGRWAGRGVQPQNLPRPKLCGDFVDMICEMLRECPPEASREALAHMPDGVLGSLTSILRGMFVAGPGRVFIGGDFSNIEGRVLAWIAREDWKVEAFKQYDAGTGPDLYCVAYARAFGGDPAEIAAAHKAGGDDRRQYGKRMELLLGFGGGVGGWLSSRKNDGWDLEELADKVYALADPADWAMAERKRQWLQVDKGQHDYISGKQYNALRLLTDKWRESNPAIKFFWHDLEEIAMHATMNPGEIVTTKSGRISYVCGKHFLYCKLPSGRVMHYARPSVRLVWSDILEGYKNTLHYWTMTRPAGGAPKWAEIASYGGLLCENVVQATARDCLVAAMKRVRKAGMLPRLHVHDELRAIVPKDKADVEAFQKLMETVPPWALGLPIAAECETMERYHK
jgi:DNA polymerase